MIYIEAPNENYSIENETENTKVFLAGGITNCPDWQSEIVEILSGESELTSKSKFRCYRPECI